LRLIPAHNDCGRVHFIDFLSDPLVVALDIPNVRIR